MQGQSDAAAKKACNAAALNTTLYIIYCNTYIPWSRRRVDAQTTLTRRAPQSNLLVAAKITDPPKTTVLEDRYPPSRRACIMTIPVVDPTTHLYFALYNTLYYTILCILLFFPVKYARIPVHNILQCTAAIKEWKKKKSRNFNKTFYTHIHCVSRVFRAPAAAATASVCVERVYLSPLTPSHVHLRVYRL